MQILENRKHNSPSGVSLSCEVSARVSAEVVIGGDGSSEHRRAERRLVRVSGKLTLVSGVTVAFGAAKCTDFCGFGGMSLSSGGGFRARLGGEAVLSPVCTALF